ncbi:hypothetical protein RHECNPAF_1700029 [Rhizobium etli CNPAF512]|nr:hypothetical protein RHECNPAF_1700029 [Rhizobium etli CNPAF512]
MAAAANPSNLTVITGRLSPSPSTGVTFSASTV